MEDERKFPTMIIPDGTDIGVNEQGQLSIKTPGNLVIQNSGSYSIVESEAGSIRIDPEVKVEAISLQASDACYIAGTLTAWRVRAKKIILEKDAQAYIMLQEADSLDLERSARMVGNFASEKELYLMLGRFNRQLQELPELVPPGGDPPRISEVSRQSAERPPAIAEEMSGLKEDEEMPGFEEDEPFVAPDGEDEETLSARQERQEILSLVRVILERELGRRDRPQSAREPLERLLDRVREDESDRLEEDYEYLFSQIENPSVDIQNARNMLDRLFE